MSAQEIIPVLADARRLGAEVATFSGGEPLLHRDIAGILTYADVTGYKVRVFTSGVYDFGDGLESISKKFLENFSGELAFSVQGAKDTHDLITDVEGSYVTVIRSIGRSIAHGKFTEVHTVPNNLNYEELEEMGELLQGVGVRAWHLLRLVPQGRAEDDARLELSVAQFEKLQGVLAGLLEKDWDMQIKLGCHLDKRYWSDSSAPVVSCGLGQRRLVVRPDGGVTYCSALKRNDYGNVREHPLAYFWEEEPSLLEFRDFLSRGFEGLKGKCSLCDILELCKGGCVAQRLYKHGSLTQGPDPLCYKKPSE